jgi:putative oxidoreductase
MICMSTASKTAPAQALASGWLNRVLGWWHGLHALLDSLQPTAALLARAYLAEAFFMSGLTKLRDWDITLALFQDEYQVPLLPPELAAVMGTAGELVLPVLLLLGLGGRVAALGLSVVNAVALLSLAEIAPVALQQHITWGVLLAGLAVFGSGNWSLDKWAQHGWPAFRSRV